MYIHRVISPAMNQKWKKSYLKLLSGRWLRMCVWLLFGKNWYKFFYFIFEGGMSLSIDIVPGGDMVRFKSGDSTQERVSR